ncbi:hypothetical protein ACF0H5_018588 [Mactra antiquata]
MAKNPDDTANYEIRNLVRQIRALEMRHVNIPEPQEQSIPPVQPVLDAAAGDVREVLADNLSTSTDEEEQAVPEPERPRRHKRPLNELIRENQELFNN